MQRLGTEGLDRVEGGDGVRGLGRSAGATRFPSLVMLLMVCVCCDRLFLGFGTAGVVRVRGIVGDTSLLLLLVGAWAGESGRQLAPAWPLVSVIYASAPRQGREH